MSHGPGRIQRQLLQILRSRRIAVDTADLAHLVYLERELTPAQRVAAWRALDGLEARISYASIATRSLLLVLSQPTPLSSRSSFQAAHTTQSSGALLMTSSRNAS